MLKGLFIQASDRGHKMSKRTEGKKEKKRKKKRRIHLALKYLNTTP
jgi:hypothetical protein